MFATSLIEKSLKLVGIEKTLKPSIISGAYIDSRLCGRGSLFFAFKGEKNDGHDYIADLLKRGVLCVGTSDRDFGENYIRVDDALEFIAILARERVKLFRGKVLAITGSSGKTSVRELTVSILNGLKKRVYASRDNFNNHLGLPLVILNLPPDVDAMVLEMGMNHAGEIKKLVEIADPDFTTITNIGTAHIGNFASHADLAAAKLEIFEYSRGVAVANMGDKYIKNWVETNEKREKRGEICRYSGENYKNLSDKFKDLPDFMVENLECAANLVSAAFGALPDLEKALKNLHIPEMRGEMKKIGDRAFIVDCYNANPQSMKKSIENFYQKYAVKQSKPCSLILGSMFELGAFSEKMHRELVKYLENLNLLCHIFLIGSEFDKVKLGFLNQKKMVFLANVAETARLLPRSGFFLIKGSRGNKLERLFDYLNSGETK